MAAITGRWTAKEDVKVLRVDTADVLAVFQNFGLDITAEEIDVTAARDLWKKREFGVLDWSMRVSSLLATDGVQFMASCIDGGTIVVSISCTTLDFLGTGMITGSPLTGDNPMTEEVTVVSAGASPTISFA